MNTLKITFYIIITLAFYCLLGYIGWLIKDL